MKTLFMGLDWPKSRKPISCPAEAEGLPGDDGPALAYVYKNLLTINDKSFGTVDLTRKQACNLLKFLKAVLEP